MDSKSTLSNFSPNLFSRFFWNGTWWQALKSGQSESFQFLKKILIMLKIGEMDHFWTQNQHWAFVLMYLKIFMKLYLMTITKKCFRRNRLHFWRKLLLCSKLGKYVTLGPKCNWWKASKSEEKWLFLYFEKDFYYARNMGKSISFYPKTKIFCLSLFIRLFWNYSWWQTLKCILKCLFCIRQENSYYDQNGVNAFLDPKRKYSIFSLNLLLTFFWICTWWKALKSD